MAGLQRSEVSFRRQGSSGLIWDDKFLNGLVNQRAQPEDNSQESEEEEGHIKEVKASTLDRSRSNGGGRAFHSGKVSPAIEPPSPKFSACGFCTPFKKPEKSRRRTPGPGKFRV